MALESMQFFELDQMRTLLSQEWDLVRQGASRVPSGAALSLGPAPVSGQARLRSHPAMIQLHLGSDLVQGDFCCKPDALPIDSDSIQLLVARHALDLLEPECGIAEELARVLAPGGTLFLFGMNLLSPWRLWSALQAGTTASRPSIRSLVRVRQRFTRASLQPLRREFLGGNWPGLVKETKRGRGGHLDGAWVLVLTKQRSAVRPIPLRRRSNAMALGNRLAQVPSRRACL